MKITKGSYYADNSDLLITIHSIVFSNKVYFKAIATLSNKITFEVYENKKYKIYFQNIKHWKRYSD